MFKNTELGCDVKTILHSDRRMRTGKDYQGILRLDSDSEVYRELRKALTGLVEEK